MRAVAAMLVWRNWFDHAPTRLGNGSGNAVAVRDMRRFIAQIMGVEGSAEHDPLR
jgi:hypothetical protein